MNRIQTVGAGSAAPDAVIQLLKESAIALQRHARDAAGLQLANRIRAFLANFPTHFVTEYLSLENGEATLSRVSLGQWPDWSDSLARSMHSGPTKPEKPEAPDHVARDLDHYTRGQMMADLASMLGTTEDPESLVEAVEELKEQAEAEHRAELELRRNDAQRLLWFVIAKHVPGGNVVVNMADLQSVDWSTAALRRDERMEPHAHHFVALPLTACENVVRVDYDDSCPYGSPNCDSADDGRNCGRCAADIAGAASGDRHE